MLKGFKDFLMRGNVVDLAVAVVIGAAFTAVITAFTDKVLNPLIAAVGAAETPGLGFFVRSGDEATFVDLGSVITAVVNFVIVAAAIYFVVVLPIAKLQARRKRNEPEEEITEDVALLREIRDLLATSWGADGTDRP